MYCSGQDGGTLSLLAQAKEGQQQFKNKKQQELTENRTVWKSDSQGDKEESFIQTRRRGRRQAAGAERTQGKVAAGGPSEVADCGAGQARLQLADPTRWWLAPLWPHICKQINQEEQQGSKADHTTQGSSAGK